MPKSISTNFDVITFRSASQSSPSAVFSDVQHTLLRFLSVFGRRLLQSSQNTSKDEQTRDDLGNVLRRLREGLPEIAQDMRRQDSGRHSVICIFGSVRSSPTASQKQLDVVVQHAQELFMVFADDLCRVLGNGQQRRQNHDGQRSKEGQTWQYSNVQMAQLFFIGVLGTGDELSR